MPDAPWQLRGAQESDAPELARLSGQLGYPVAADVMAIRLRDTHEDVFVADRRGELLGFIVVEIQASFVSGALAEIGGLVVDERIRGSGIGAQLLAFAERWARERGVTKLRVHSNRIRERAHAFYQREGYEIAKTQHVFVKDI